MCASFIFSVLFKKSAIFGYRPLFSCRLRRSGTENQDFWKNLSNRTPRRLKQVSRNGYQSW
jgi:hypothetical protein